MSDISQFAPLWGKWEVKELIGKGSFGKVYHLQRVRKNI